MSDWYLRCDPVSYYARIVGPEYLGDTEMTTDNYDRVFRAACKDKIEGVGLSAAEKAEWQPRRWVHGEKCACEDRGV
ncbi:uncharacterized protein PG986_002265 [Apiospora aurea]|uniref:Uncharacterized protein n=1 Tax=Apiospora aurea TaxID=335848 RepID=A0ABR1QZA6_9PEZI